MMESSQDIDIFADLFPLEGLVEFRHPLRSKNHIAVGAEGAFGR
jgi:hypothetical protein